MKNLAELRTQLIEWLSQVKTWGDGTKQCWEDYITDDPKNNAFRLLIYTNDHSYSISVHFHENGKHYLGCIASTRKPRAGEDWTRGNDLPDGDFSKKTFDAIMRKIVGYELIAKVKKQEPATIDLETMKTYTDSRCKD